MKKYFIITLFLFINLFLFSLHYYSNDFFYSIDLSDNWELIDDSKNYNIFFRNDKKNSFVEVTSYEKKSAKTLQALFDSFVKRYEMTGTNKVTTFCQYEAIRGTYSLVSDGMDLRMDMVAFGDKYYYYVIMGYAERPKFNMMRGELFEIIQSFKIYYDGDIVKSNNGNEDKIVEYKEKEEDNLTNKKVVEKNDKKNTGKEYYLSSNWGKYKKEFPFIEDDYYSAMDEMKEIMDAGIWNYYNIDTNQDGDFNFSFWARFYQDMYNKNYYRVTEVVEWFKKEAKDKKWDAYALADNVMKSVQVIPYERPKNLVKDKKNSGNNLDYFTPNEIAWYNKGDCDTKSLFMVLVLRRLGFDAVMYYSYDYGHAMVGLNINAKGTYKTYNNLKYYFIESTYAGWKIGDIPPDMNNTKKWRLIPIK